MKKILIFIAALIFAVGCGGGNSGEPASDTSCANNGAFNCRNNVVMQCENNEWQKIEQCNENQKCNAEKGICETVENGDTSPENPDTDDSDTDSDQETDTDSSDTAPDKDADTVSDTDADTTPDNPDTEDADSSTSDDTDSAPDDDNDTDVVKPVDEESCIAAGGSWNSGKCTKSVNCTDLPENASWNKTTGIKQTWNGTEWEPSEIGTYSETASTTECVFKCNTNYSWNEETSTCDAATHAANCTGLPENAVWNTVSEITQTWSGSAWLPSTTGVYDESASEEECRFKCATNYTWNGSSCAADTKSGNCSSKPANTVWNDNDKNGKFSQTWNGTSWDPASYASEYSKTAGTCKYVCTTGYIWSENQCVEAPTQTASCTGLPANAQWNTASYITQTYDGTEWFPGTTGVYNETASSTECRFKCNTNYNWNSSTSKCVAATQTANCTGLPANAQWNTVSSITQTWNGSTWAPATTGSYNETASPTECRYKCKTNYNWNSSISTCVAATQQGNCSSKPANTAWNDNGANGKFDQTWDGSAWMPSSYASGYSKTAGTCKYVCATGYIWSDNQCITAPTQTASCTGLPENAQWNTASSITQTYDGSEWYPSTAGTYNATASTRECHYKCKTNYNWQNSQCVAATQSASCIGLPANASWNTASSITQTWNGSSWQPTTTGTYNETASTTECHFGCNMNYNWNSSTSTCVAATQQANCSSKPANTVWNDNGANGKFDQTWTGTSWTPVSYASSYSTSAGVCKYKCATGYLWDGVTCDVAPTQTVSCTGLPAAGAAWNTVSSITQTWDGEKWTPSATGTYNETESTTECHFKCLVHYKWNGSICVADTKNSPCMGLPENAQWNTATSIKQTWNGSTWAPSTTGIYNETASESECRFKCNTDYFWDGSECMTPCDYEPCEEVANSTHVCTATAWNDYSCECNGGYFWKYGECTVLPQCSKSSGTPCKDSSSNLTWSARKLIPWQNAVEYCSTYSERGLSGWRMPTIKELGTLLIANRITANCNVVNSNCQSMACWSCSTCTQTGTDCSSSFGTSYSDGRYSKFGDTTCIWSSSYLIEDPDDSAWYISFSEGYVYRTRTTSSCYIRCVRNTYE